MTPRPTISLLSLRSSALHIALCFLDAGNMRTPDFKAEMWFHDAV